MKLEIKKTSNTLITQAYDSRRNTRKLLIRSESLETFEPSYALSKLKKQNDAIRNWISDFDQRHISQPKTQ